MKDLNAVRNEIIASFEANVRSMTEQLNGLDNGAMGQYIVMCDGLAIDVDAPKGTVGGMVVPVIKATRFNDKASAEKIAARVVNGRGDRGYAVLLPHALSDSIIDFNEHIASLKAGE